MRSFARALRVAAAGIALGATLLISPLSASPALAAPAPVSSLFNSSCPTNMSPDPNTATGCVVRLQNLLNQKGSIKITVDGYFGANTTRAVVAFQSAHGLAADGIVGPKTKSALEGGSTPAPAPTGTTAAKIVAYASALGAGKAEPGWGGGKIPYSWGGGHNGQPGPSLGTCAGYRGSIQPCPATKTVGLDCSGLSRYVYSLAYGRDVLGAGTAADQKRKMVRVSNPQPGDLAFYGNASDPHHVAIYMGGGQIAEAPYTGAYVTVQADKHGDLIGYYRLP